MFEDAAVLDAPVLDNEPVEPIEPAEPEPLEPVDDELGTEPTEPFSEIKGDDRTLPRWIRDMKETRPADFRAARDNFFQQKELQGKLKDFDLDGTKAFLEEHGGRETIMQKMTEMQEKSSVFEGFQKGLQAGDRRVAAAMAQESPEGFSKLAPALMETWRETDPEAWTQSMSGVMAATIAQSGVPAYLDKMEMMLQYGDTANFGEALKTLKGWVSSFSQAASAPIASKAPKQSSQLDQREQTVAQREQGLFDTELTREEDAFRMPAIQSALETYISRRPKDEEAKNLAIDTVRAKVKERLDSDKNYRATLDTFKRNRDKDGALRLIKSREQAAIAEIAPKVGRTIFGAPAAKVTKDVVPNRVTPQRPAPVTTDPHDAIFSRIASR